VYETLRDHYAVVFNGNNYSEEWVQEAARRGLPNLKTGPEALAVYDNPKNIELFKSLNILAPNELNARAHVGVEGYLKRLAIEGNALLSILNTQILPAAITYQGRLAESIKITSDIIGAQAVEPQKQLLLRVNHNITRLQEEAQKLDALLKDEHKSHADEKAKLAEFHPKITAQLRHARGAADDLERVVDDELWPLPKYNEILFLK